MKRKKFNSIKKRNLYKKAAKKKAAKIYNASMNIAVDITQ